jgi:hypothetical protein
MLLTNKQISVLGDTKCQGVQTLLDISVTITLVPSCWARAFSTSSKQPATRRYFPALLVLSLFPPPTRKAGTSAIPRNCLYSPTFREYRFSETRSVRARKYGPKLL